MTQQDGNVKAKEEVMIARQCLWQLQVFNYLHSSHGDPCLLTFLEATYTAP